MQRNIDPRELAIAVNNAALKESRTHVFHALCAASRILTAFTYSEVMASSRDICLEDAKNLLNQAISEIEQMKTLGRSA